MPADGETPETSDTPRMGRPPKLVESEELLKQIEGLARIQCTQREAAAVLRVHRDTFADFLGSHEKAMEAWENGHEQGKASLRRLQFKSAENGNATMQIWLGKQWIEQKDSVVHAGDATNPLGFVIMSGVPRRDADTDGS